VSSADKNASIDIVFLWVDGSDRQFAELKRRHLPQHLSDLGLFDELVGDATRYLQMGEIAYAVRSVRLFVPWIRTVYIVIADGQQLPSSLRSVAGLRVVRHSDIIPADFLPTFCSSSIEPFVHKISGLSEMFIYGNDDFMFWNMTPLSYFVKNAELVFRGAHLSKLFARLGARIRRGHPKIASRTALLLYDYGFQRVYMPEHAFEIFRRSTCYQAWKELQPIMRKAVVSKFRDDERALFWRMIVNAYEGRFHNPVHVRSWNGCDVPFARVENSWIVAKYVQLRLMIVKRSQREVVCFNTIPPTWHARMRRFLDAHYERSEGYLDQNSTRSSASL
jgi:hypothetical protein